jgi:hypothetical protein
MKFSFTAKRRLLGITKSVAVSAEFIVGDTEVLMDVRVPAFIVALVGEERIRSAFEQEFDSRLGDPGKMD